MLTYVVTSHYNYLGKTSAECYNVLCPLFKKNEYYIPLELESNVLSP